MPKQPTPEPDQGPRLNVRLDRPDHDRFRKAAEALGVDKSALARMIVISFNTGAPMPRNPLLATHHQEN